MAASPSDLADKIKAALGQSDKPTSAQTTGLATAVLQLFQAATFSHVLITGVTAAGAPLGAGAALAGVIAGYTGPALAQLMVANGVAPSLTPQVSGMANGIAGHISTGLVVFAPGGITGQCTSSPLSPGPLAAGQGQNGVITGLAGPAMASLVGPPLGGAPTAQVVQMCAAICDYVTANIKCAYLPATVNGLCPPASGPLGGGVGIGGKFQ